MIDNVKFFVTNKDEFEQNVCKKANIDFKASHSIITGEILEYPKKGKFHNIDVVITPTGAYLNGSLHKLYNCLETGEEHNYNDFYYCDLIDVLDVLQAKLGIDRKQTKITNLEFGFNILVDKDAKDIIDKNVLMFNQNVHSKYLQFGGKGDYKEFQVTDYSIKIYNKAKQYSQKEYILRVEIKITKKRILERLGIFNLNDLKNKEKLKSLYDFFIDKIKRLQIIDEFEDRLNILKKDKDKLIKFTSSFHWITIKSKSQKIKNNQIKEFNRLVKMYKLDSLHNDLLDKLQNKFFELLEPQFQRVTA